MWRMKVLAVSMVLLGALLFGSVVVFAGWGWNAKVNIEGTMISTSWSVTDDVNGAADYHADITITVTDGADVNVIKVAPRETLSVVHRTGDLVCNNGVIRALVSYVITGDGDGTDVSVSVDRVKGKLNYDSATGKVGSTITVNGPILAECSS